jgi:hypothetical protein
VAGEERGEPLAFPDDGLHSRHDRASQRARKVETLRLAIKSVDDGKGMRTRYETRHRCHQPKPKKAAIADEQRTIYRRGECDLDVPEALLLEACAFCERFDAGACCFERLTLNSYGLDMGACASMA